MAFKKMGAADLAASSAALLRLRIASSTCWPKPALRKAFSTFAASGGSRIFTAASLKKPSTADNLSALFLVPWDSASFLLATLSSDLRDFPPFRELTAFLSLPSKPPCAFTRITEQNNNNITEENFFILDILIFIIRV